MPALPLSVLSSIGQSLSQNGMKGLPQGIKGAAGSLAKSTIQSHQSGSALGMKGLNSIPQLQNPLLAPPAPNSVGTSGVSQSPSGDQLPPELEDFYFGPQQETADAALKQTNSPTADVFEEFPDLLHNLGGSDDPTSLLALQYQLTQDTLRWSVYGQLASKAVSGIQTMFNNQV